MPIPGETKRRRILLVDDDPVVLKVYEKGLGARGYEVELVPDGLTAIKALTAKAPDLVVLDLMMPKMSGVDVLKFIRGKAATAQLPVIVLSNAYMDEMAREAATVGAQKALLKASCTPAQLDTAIQEVLSGQSASQDPSMLLAAPASAPAQAQQPALAPSISPLPHRTAGKSWAAAAARTRPSPEPKENQEQPEAPQPDQGQLRQDFLAGGSAACAELRSLFELLANARNEAERKLRLQAFSRKANFLAAAAGAAGCARLARLAATVEAFCLEAMGKSSQLSASSLRTLAQTVEFFPKLFAEAKPGPTEERWSPKVVVVDDDVISNRVVVSALRGALMTTIAYEDPLSALNWLKTNACELLLLDIEMPKMDGLELCRQLRALPQHAQTPVVFVTNHSDFESQSKTVLAGGNDLIGKPISAQELAVKAVMHVLRRA